MRTLMCLWLVGAFFTASSGSLPAQQANYDEKKVPAYTLPDPLETQAGERVASKADWESIRRPEILRLFTGQMYGRAPRPKRPITFRQRVIDREALGGKATFKEVTIQLMGVAAGPSLDVLVVIPNKMAQPVPAFVGLNFYGNASTTSNSNVSLTNSWLRTNPSYGVPEHRMTEKTRGARSTRWPYEQIIDRGFAVATAYYGDIDPDFDDGFQNGIHPWFYKKGQVRPAADEWGSIAAWAWGLSRIMDYFEQQDVIDSGRVAVMGHSRLGKTALWAGATDPRFSIVISNDSGCGGAALSRRRFGETVQRINTSFPHWFCGNFKQYNGREDALPMDQHMLIALMAPRPVLVCSAEQDRWADPRGEFLSCLHASPVYRLLGTEGLGATAMPAVHHPVLTRVGYHIRAGKHDVTSLDWKTYCDFADRHWRTEEKESGE